MKRTLILLLCLFSIATSFAKDWTDEKGVTWSYELWNTNEARIIGASNYSENVVIPSEIEGHVVTRIGNASTYPFKDKTDIKSVRLPETLTYIGRESFYGCSNLESINIPNCVTTIDNYAFRDCSLLDNITIPSGVTKIQQGVFRGCSNLTNIVLPDGLISLNTYAFYGCSNLVKIEIPNSVTEIGENAFQNCSNLENINIPDGVTDIKWEAFYKCSKLVSITLPKGVTTIGTRAFFSCTSLSSLTLPPAILEIGTQAFLSCSKLTSISCLSATPPSLSADAFTYLKTVHVCEGLKDAYMADPVWGKLNVIDDLDDPSLPLPTTITNASFANGVIGNVNIATYEKDMAAGDVCRMQKVPGWKFDTENEDARAAGIVAYGSSTTLGGTSYKVPTVAPEGSNGNALAMVAVWSASVKYIQDVLLPAGKYIMTAPVYNTIGNSPLEENYIGVEINNTPTYATTRNYAVGKWTKELIIFEVAEGDVVRFSLGCKSGDVGSSSAQHLFIDNVKVEEYSELNIAKIKAIESLPVGDESLFTPSAKDVKNLKSAIEAAETLEDVKNALSTKLDIPALSGVYTILNVASDNYLARNDANVVLSSSPVTVAFETADDGFYIKTNGVYINMQGNNDWSLSADATAKTAWKFTLSNGSYTISGPKGMIGTDNKTEGSFCYGNKDASKNGEWCIATATSVSKVLLSRINIKLTEEDSFRVCAFVLPFIATDTRVKWLSTNPAVAQVSSDGMVTAVSEGNAVIKCIANDGDGIMDSCFVSVEPNADVLLDGIFVSYNDASTCYKLSSIPSIEYKDVDGERHALLYVDNGAEPVLDMALVDDQSIVVTYGQYLITDNHDMVSDRVNISERNGKKILKGGRLIIIGNDGRKYTASGVEIK